MEFAYPASKLLFGAALRLFSRWQVEGTENVPPAGPVIVVANHQSYVDPPLLAASLPRRLYFLATRQIFRGPLASALLRNYGAFAVEGDGNDLGALRWALARLRRSQVVALFPEGKRNPHGLKAVIHPGAAYLAVRSGVPILPVKILGTERLGPLWRVAVPTGRLRVIVGQPFTVAVDGARKESRAHLKALAELIMERVDGLQPGSAAPAAGAPSRQQGSLG